MFFTLVHDSNGLSIDGKPLLPVNVPLPIAKFQLFLLVKEHAEDASLVLEFQRGALDPDMAERLLVHLERLLQAATEQVDTPLWKLPLLGSSELDQLRTFGSCERPYARDSTVAGPVRGCRAPRGEATALVAGVTELSYAALDRRANAVAATLHSAGVDAATAFRCC